MTSENQQNNTLYAAEYSKSRLSACKNIGCQMRCYYLGSAVDAVKGTLGVHDSAGYRSVCESQEHRFPHRILFHNFRVTCVLVSTASGTRMGLGGSPLLSPNLSPQS